MSVARISSSVSRWSGTRDPASVASWIVSLWSGARPPWSRSGAGRRWTPVKAALPVSRRSASCRPAGSPGTVSRFAARTARKPSNGWSPRPATPPPRDSREMSLSFGKAERSGRVVFELLEGHLQVGEPPRVLLHDAGLWLERGEHVTLVGANGTGKSTLIRALTGERPLDGGRLSTGHNVNLGYLSQHAEELGDQGTVLSVCQRHTQLAPNKARALLGRFLFSGQEAEKPMAGLSGGERRRLSLAVLVASGANVLILDEPTNHLDLESREALEDALLAFEGAVLLVSHDRALLDAVGSRTIAIEGGVLRSYEGGWAEYQRVREERRARGEDVNAGPPQDAKAPPSADARRPDGRAAVKREKAPKPRPTGPSKNALREEERLQRAVEQAEAALTALEAELADPVAWATPYESAKSQARHTAAKRAVEEAYAAWEAHAAKVGA